MKRIFPRRPGSSSLEPTPAQLKTAEETMYAAVCRGHGVVVTSNGPGQARVYEDQRDSVEDGLSELASTPVEEFLINFRESGSEFLGTAYLMDHPIRSELSGALFSSLPEDVFALIEAQASLLDEYLKSTHMIGTEIGDSVLADALFSIFRNLKYNQTSFRNIFLKDLESCLCAANDFLRMAEQMDNLMQMVAARYSHLVWIETEGDDIASVARREFAELLSLFSSDAVHASQRAVNFVMQTIQQSSISTELFSREWEDQLVLNEVAVAIVRTFEDYLSDIRNYLEHDFLYHKVVGALVQSTVCFYVQCFVNKADKVRCAMQRGFGGKRVHKIAFLNARRAICRMNYDIGILREYFYGVAKESPALARVVANELSVLVIMLECMWLAIDQTGANNLEDFILVVHKRTGADSGVTRYFLSDLWLLMGPKNGHRVVENTVKMMHAELQLVSIRLKEREPDSLEKKNTICFRLDEMLRSLYEDRIFQAKSSMCGSIIRDVKELREGLKVESEAMKQQKRR